MPLRTDRRSSLPSRIRERNRHRTWWIRAALLVWFGLVLRGFVGSERHASLWSGINLGFHELGHVLFAPFPPLLTAAGGTLTELAVPVVAGVLLIRRRDDFGGTVGLFWLGTALAGIAPYAGDARTQALSIVSPFPGSAGHDWSYFLGTLGLLEHDAAIAAAFRISGLGAMAGGIAAGAWIVGLMATDPERRPIGSSLKRGSADALAREDAAFRAWWAAQEGDSNLSVPTPESNEPREPSPPSTAAEFLDRKEAGEGGLTPEEERFRDWLRNRD